VGLLFALWCVLITFLTVGRARVAFYGYATVWYWIESSRLVPVQEVQVAISKFFIVALMVMVLLSVHRRMQLLEIQRSQLLGSVSHELRNQLTGVIGMIDLALPENSGLTHEEVRDLIGLARREAMDASALIEDLLTASRMEGNALDVVLEPIDADKEVARIIDHYPAEGMTFRQVGTRSGVVALGDQVRLRQILRNLLTNATRYGGKDVTLNVTPGESTVLIEVSDDGPGVPVGETETIFLPYRRASHTPRHSSSVGIGLWVSRKLARAMHGDLTYRRENGRTIFEIKLPKYTPIDGSHDKAATQASEHSQCPTRQPIDQTAA
jgi:signal transduction histidine kinase